MVDQTSFQMKAVFQKKKVNNILICHKGKQTGKSQTCQRGSQ